MCLIDDTTSKRIDFNYSDHGVVFSIRDCSLDGKYSFWKMDKKEAERLIKRLGYFENMTWRQFSALPREKGITKEKKNTESFEMIKNQDSSTKKIAGETYYFHFRVSGTKKTFRVFGYQERHFFCITHIDREGRIHHK